jgi:hypothetical protein
VDDATTLCVICLVWLARVRQHVSPLRRVHGSSKKSNKKGVSSLLLRSLYGVLVVRTITSCVTPSGSGLSNSKTRTLNNSLASYSTKLLEREMISSYIR